MNGKIYYQENDLRKEYEIKMKSSPEFHSLAVLLLFFVSNMFPQNLFPLLPFFLPSSFLHLCLATLLNITIIIIILIAIIM